MSQQGAKKASEDHASLEKKKKRSPVERLWEDIEKGIWKKGAIEIEFNGQSIASNA